MIRSSESFNWQVNGESRRQNIELTTGYWLLNPDASSKAIYDKCVALGKIIATRRRTAATNAGRIRKA
jgi:hypothetical protein